MKTIYTNTQKEEKANFWAYIRVVFVIILFSAFIQTTLGQNGKLKLKADIVNVDNDQTQSLVTLFRIPANGAGTFVLGQFIVTGNDWFKTHLELEKEYMLEIASTNGLTKRFYFNTNVPQDLEGSKLKMDLALDMGWSETAWPVVKAGEVAFENRSTEFAVSNRVNNNSVAMNPNK